MGDEAYGSYVASRRAGMGAAPDPAKAKAERRANVARDIDDGLLADFPAARNTDPETSHQAAHQVRVDGTKAAHQLRVLQKVLALPGLCYLELAVQTGLEKHAVMRRLNDLEKAGLVCKGPTRVIRRRAYTTWWPGRRPPPYTQEISG